MVCTQNCFIYNDPLPVKVIIIILFYWLDLPALVDPWQGIDDQVDAKSEEKIRRNNLII